MDSPYLWRRYKTLQLKILSLGSGHGPRARHGSCRSRQTYLTGGRDFFCSASLSVNCVFLVKSLSLGMQMELKLEKEPFGTVRESQNMGNGSSPLTTVNGGFIYPICDRGGMYLSVFLQSRSRMVQVIKKLKIRKK